MIPPAGEEAEAIGVGRRGDLTFADVRELVDEVVTVADEGIARALLMLLERIKLVVEPAGAAGPRPFPRGALPEAPGSPRRARARAAPR